MWHYAIIGIGLNLNQGKFPEHLPNAVSLKQITGKNWDAATLAQELCRCLDARIRTLQMSALDTLLAEYTAKLFRWQQPGLYRKDGVVFQGIIRDVLPDGHLCLEREGEVLRLGFGEVEFVLS